MSYSDRKNLTIRNNLLSEYPFFQHSAILKKEFNVKKYSKLKIAANKSKTMTLLVKEMREKINTFEQLDDREQRGVCAHKLIEYLYERMDIWSMKPILAQTVKDKLYEYAYNEPAVIPYLYLFGWLCPYRLRNGKICNKNVDNVLCTTHFNCNTRIKERILRVCSHLPFDICLLISEYIDSQLPSIAHLGKEDFELTSLHMDGIYFDFKYKKKRHVPE